MFTALAKNFGNLRDKINLFVALCPITNLGYSTASITQNAGSKFGYSTIANTLYSFSIHELLGSKSEYLSAAFCLVFPCSALSAFSDSKESK